MKTTQSQLRSFFGCGIAGIGTGTGAGVGTEAAGGVGMSMDPSYALSHFTRKHFGGMIRA